MKTSVWRLIEAVIQAGPAQRNTCDLVMLLNTRFSSEEDFKKFSGFVIGLLKYDLLFSHLELQILIHFDTCSMSSLHIWFSKLKWSLDVLLRFYERHAFICGLHKVKQQRAVTISNIHISTPHYVRAGDQAAV